MLPRLLRGRALAVLLGVAAAALAGGGCASAPDRVGAGYASHVVCSLHFNSGLDAEQVQRDYVRADLGPFGVFVGTALEPERHDVLGRAFGLVRVRSVLTPGRGCTLLAQGAPEPPALVARALPGVGLPADRPWPEGRAGPPAPSPALAAALERAFAEPYAPDGPRRQTLAVVVAHRGRLVAERYAPGIGPQTPLLSWSMAKSVLAALLGIAAEEGRVDLLTPAPVPEWQADPDDPRQDITLDMLMRMSSGLAFSETTGARADLPIMLFAHADTGAYAASKPLAYPVDTHWAYSSGSAQVIARVLRDRFGGDVSAFRAWALSHLFEPAGMTTALLEFDASGTFIGSSFAFLSARDWARFGELHRLDGVWQGRRVLPAGWVDYVTTPTPAAPRGIYGAGWWLNAGDPAAPEQRMWPSLPRDTYAARGHSGEYVVVVPSQELVVVRLGLSHPGEDELHGIEPLVRDVIAAVASDR